ncbi:hypothetical protein B9Z19DRAFT_1079052 [Tuber borchii]|uniref:Uncharacterized protein n=1 Tax=Tuber borchii TaxID=42251 RepID=A0A2T6ZYR6_TUBBO|nr:hypothetical protein B9Z19DRAFT_1079052 [Tuber borchii]
MPRQARASRKPPAGEEVEKASKKVATTGKKEKKTAEKEIVGKPVAPPVRATRSRGMVELVIETSQASQATVASTHTSPEKPTTARRRGQSQQPVALIAEVTTSPPKRSTRATANSTTTATTTSITIEEVIHETPSPKKPTRATTKVSLHKKQKSNSRVAAAPPTPEITPLSPEIQVPASSDAENHSPAGSPHFASSPPAIMGTAPRDGEEELTTPTQTKGKSGKQKRVSLEFAEDEGYTPPRARPSSAERPRLRELGVESLEPLDRLPGIDENDVASSVGFAGDDEDEPASPTPKRANKWKLSQLAEEEEEEAGEEADLEDNDEVPASAQLEQQHRKKRFGSPFQFQTGKKKDAFPTATVTAMEVEDMTFAIYSDPNTPSPTLPDTTSARELDEIMRPPLSSSPAQESPQHSRKRRSSSAGIGSDDEVSDRAEEHRDQTRGGKRRKQAVSRSKLAATSKKKDLQTEDLRGLLPKRKGRGRPTEKDEFDLPPSGEEGEEDEDELSKPTKRKSKPTKKSKSKTKSKSTAPTTTAKITKSAWSRPLVPNAAAAATATKKTYARKSTGSGKENEAPRVNKSRNDEGPGEEEEEDDETAATTTSGTVVELADGILGKEGRRKLRDAAEKFRVVDAWEMEFEDVSASPS